MWSPDRRAFLAGLATAALAGCGFEPALAPTGPARELTGDTAVTAPSGRLGFALRRSLTRRLGRAGATPRYRLVADLVLTESGLAITTDSSINRFLVRGVSSWRLTGPEGFADIEGDAESLTSFSAAGSLFAARAARRDAEERVAEDLGERIADQLAAALADRRLPE